MRRRCCPATATSTAASTRTRSRRSWLRRRWSSPTRSPARYVSTSRRTCSARTPTASRSRSRTSGRTTTRSMRSIAKSVKPEQFRQVYDPMFKVSVASGAKISPLYDWRPQSTYIRRPPYWEGALAGERTLKGLRPLAVLGDNITTDHLSPSNAIMLDSAAGEYLAKMGLPEEDFNSYATHRGDHLTAQRATFANPTLINEMALVDGTVRKGSLARIEPDGKVVRMWEAIETYMDRKQPLIIVAGADYGQGSSRDWAAKGVRLAGVEAIVAEGFERIHRTNLVGMGVLPLEFKRGRQSQDARPRRHRNLRRDRRPHAARNADARDHAPQRRARRSAGDLPSRYRGRSLDLRSRRRAAALCAGFPRIHDRNGGVTNTDRIHGPAHRRSRSRPRTCVAAPARACSSGCRTCLRARRCRARRAMPCCCASSAAPIRTASRSTAWAARPRAPARRVILSKSSRPDHDVDYLFGQVSIDKAFVDWSGNCGNLSAAVGLVRDQQRARRRQPRFRGRRRDRAHLAGQHRQDHRRARADRERRRAGNRRLRTRRRDVPGRRSAARVHRTLRPTKTVPAAAMFPTGNVVDRSRRARRRHARRRR